ncbi:MAG: hypothetical protein RLZ62_1817 [Bacteroidota bacterium]|jgi:hypothetical protein
MIKRQMHCPEIAVQRTRWNDVKILQFLGTFLQKALTKSQEVAQRRIETNFVHAFGITLFFIISFLCND